MAKWTFYAADLLTGEVREEIPCTAFAYSPALNRAGSWSAKTQLRARTGLRLDYEDRVRSLNPTLYYRLNMAAGPTTWGRNSLLAPTLADGQPSHLAGALYTNGIDAAGLITEDSDRAVTLGFVNQQAETSDLAAPPTRWTDPERALTFALWIQSANYRPGGGGTILEVRNSSGNRRLELGVDGSGHPRARATDSAGTLYTATGTTVIADNSIAMLAARWDKDTGLLTVLLNGMVDASLDLSATPLDLGPELIVSVGTPTPTLTRGQVSGTYDELAVWIGRAVTDAELRGLYRLGAGGKTVNRYRYTSDTLAPWRTAVFADRGGRLVWGGIVTDDQQATLDNQWAIGGPGPFGYLREKRLLRESKSYTGVEQLAIVRDLLAYAEGKLGGSIGLGWDTTTVTGVLRDRSWEGFERKLIGELLEQLAAVENGFDFATVFEWNAGGPAWRLVFGYPQLGRNIGTLEQGKNILVLARDRNGEGIANLIDGMGAGEGAGQLVATVTEPGRIGIIYPLLEAVASYKDIVTGSALDGHVRADLAAAKDPAELVSVELLPSSDLELGSFMEGDSVLIVVNDGPVQVNTPFRLMGYTVNADADGREKITLDLAESGLFIP